MKKNRKLWASVLVAAIITSLAGGCQSREQTESGESMRTEADNAQTQENTALAGTEAAADTGEGESESSAVSDTQTADASNEEEEMTEVSYSRVSVHDPSVVYDNGTYYIFGSHMAWAKSTDLMNWETFTMNINSDYAKLFGKEWDSYCKTNSNPNLNGNLWAPDVIYNPNMGKYCFYMSVNGDDWNSVIVMLTADQIEGPYEYGGPIVYSGFNTGSHDVALTDVYQVLGEGADITRYQNTTNTKLNCIDPNVLFDKDGSLWMVYGSWFGGLYMLKLDEKVADGGYQMRVFRSDKITGPYVDQAGNNAVYTKQCNDLFEPVGVRLMGSYDWTGNREIRVAQGHNSAYVTEDGKIYLIYHSRFAEGKNGIPEAHEVRVQQLFVNEDGWLVAAPYEYAGEEISETGYTMEEMCGNYEFVVHNPTTYYQKVGKAVVGVMQPAKITLNEDGSVSGDLSGNWTYEEGTPNMTITVDNVTYKGVFLKMPSEQLYFNPNQRKVVMTFSVLGENVTAWGSK
ncbi:MAG: glycoside hydrolase family 43 protein [Lachnospiraceae bacterium]|nr:glycoside hydrolase family 43 protein [Lachnospiraceae bacterium]